MQVRLLHNTERVCKWKTKKENQRKDYATRRACCTVMTCITCNLLAIARSYFKYHIWQSVRPPDMLELAYVTKSCTPKQEGRTHIKGIQICKNFSKLWKWFSSCALTHKQYLVKGYWTALGHPPWECELTAQWPPAPYTELPDSSGHTGGEFVKKEPTLPTATNSPYNFNIVIGVNDISRHLPQLWYHVKIFVISINDKNHRSC